MTYSWSGGGSSRTKVVTVPGTYTVTVTSTSNGCTATATTVVTQDVTAPNATADNIGGPLTCIDNAVTIRAFPNDPTYTYNWSGPGGYAATSRTNIISTLGTYNVTVTNSVTGCTSSASTVVVQDINLPTVNVNNDGPLTCIKTSVTLLATPGSGLTYAWSGGGTNQTKIVSIAGTYTVTVTSTTNGCTATGSTIVTQNITPPAASATNDGPLTCTKTSVTLTANPATGVTYSWSGGGNNRTKIVSVAGTYTVTVTSTTNGCSSVTTTVVTENKTPPNATADNIGGPITCIDNAATIRAFPNSASYTYSWAGPNGYASSNRTNVIANSGTYTVTVTDTDNGCTKSSSTTVLQDIGFPTVNAGSDRTKCNDGVGLTLTATGSGTFRWNTNATTATINVTPTSTTTYTVTVTGINGCTASDQVIVNVTQLPVSGITGPNEICVDEYAVFSASPSIAGATYAWTFDGGTSLDGDANDVTESIKWASIYQNTTRTVTLTVTKDNCSSVYTKDILIKQGAFLNTTSNYPVCQGGTVQIGPNPNDPNQVTPGATFQWTPNLFLNSNTAARPLSTPPFDITYTLTATVNGCAVSRQITVDVNVNLNPIADAGADKNVCITESVQIGGSPTATPPPSGGATISGVIWNIPPSGTITSTQSNPLVSPTTNTAYRVIVVASNGCTDTDFVNVNVVPKQKIGNYTWIDTNGNGCQDSNETGINGVLITLYTSGGSVVGTTTSANNPVGGAAGYYQFDVCPGIYYVNFGKPAGYAYTGEKVCGNTGSDSDANAISGNTANITIVSGQDNLTIDAGYKPVGNIRGNVTADTNNDNIGDTPMNNVTLQLKDAVSGVVLFTTTTNAQGNYEFLNVLAGNYIIMQIQPVGYQSVSDVDATPDPDGNDGSTPNNMIPVTLTVGENDNDNNFVEEQLGNIRGNVTADTNNDNIGDIPMNNVTIQLKDAATGVVLLSTTTNAQGNYQFLNVAPGNYTIMEVQPVGYQSVSDVDATPDPDGNDGITPNDMIPVVLTAGEDDNDNNFVEEQLGNIRGNVTADTNGDKIGDTPMNNVTIQLKDAVSGVVLLTTTTNTLGNYQFLNVAPGNYTIMEVQPAGYSSVSDADATPDPDGNDGVTPNDMIPVVLTAGEDDNDNNFVEEQNGNIRGNVSVDTNNDNIGDTPLNNVTIQLKDAVSGVVLLTTTTNTLGNYQFLNVAPGNYIIMEIQPAGYASVSDVDATPDPDGNDGSTPNDMIPVTLTAGENDNDNNFVERNNASIGNFVWHDLDADGVQDPGEPGIGNVVVRLINGSGVQIASTSTFNTGFYSFTNLTPGTYTVKFDKPDGYEPTGKDKGGNDQLDSDANITNGLTIPIVLAGGENNTTIDAGFYKFAKLGDFVWEDRNANGVQDAFEPGIQNVTVTLNGTDGQNMAVSRTTTTSSTGFYEFTNLVPGSYTVTFTKPAGVYKSSPANTPNDDARDSDASTTTGQTSVINLISGDNNQTIDAGFYRCAYVGDYVWLDRNLNDLQDVGDVGLNGILVELYKTSNPTTPVQTMLTINDPRPGQGGKLGYYTFEVCDLGNYFIKVRPDMGLYNWVQPNQGLDDGIDSDVIDFINQSTLIFTVSYAAAITDIDAGVKLKPLPVTLKSFTGKWNQNKDINELTWVTASENNNDYFAVERSFRGSDYNVVGTIIGQGNSNREVTYQMDDQDIGVNGVYTYRLRQVDFDGKTSYSSPIDIVVERKAETSTSIYPNPSIGMVNMTITAGEGQKVSADVYDNTGRIVLSNWINKVSEGKEMSSRIEQGQLTKGIYYIMVKIDGDIKSHKLIILE
ncbi:MAG: SdrD B-like domain-containing protein [Saprospiraceae bacterium]